MSFRRLTNAIVVAVVFLLLFSACGTRLLAMAGNRLPAWMDAEYSQFEGRQFEAFPTVSIEQFADGDFQSSFEKYASDQIPLRDYLLLGNAAVQRAEIEIANSLFGFASFPTYFDSDRLYCPDVGSICQMPAAYSNDLVNGLNSFADGLARVSALYPDVRFIVVIVDASPYSMANPASEYVSSRWTTRMTDELFKSVFAKLDNVEVVSYCYDDEDCYYDDYFKTDPHWNIVGVSRIYNLVAGKLGLKAFDPYPLKEVDTQQFFGSYSRNSLMPASEAAIDTAFSFDCLTLLMADGTYESGDQHSAYYSSSEEARRYDFYSLYYGSLGTSSEMLSDQSGQALLVSDSYGFALKRPLALNYEKLFTDGDLHAYSKNPSYSIVTRLSMGDVRDVVFCARTDNYAELLNRMPKYFD